VIATMIITEAQLRHREILAAIVILGMFGGLLVSVYLGIRDGHRRK
jgi:hypothetical protein